MDDLSLDHYITQEHRIKELETKLRTATQRASKYKRMYQDLGGKLRAKTRTEKAMKLITGVKTGELTMTYKEIAEQCCLSHQHVWTLSSQYNKRSK